jgi:hypothetical protein
VTNTRNESDDVRKHKAESQRFEMIHSTKLNQVAQSWRGEGGGTKPNQGGKEHKAAATIEPRRHEKTKHEVEFERQS